MDWKCRIKTELDELDQKRTRLDARLQQPQGHISDRQWDLMHKQAETMAAYALILQERIVEACNG